jgi:hypothetical protein
MRTHFNFVNCYTGTPHFSPITVECKVYYDKLLCYDGLPVISLADGVNCDIELCMTLTYTLFLENYSC